MARPDDSGSGLVGIDRRFHDQSVTAQGGRQFRQD
jgi:hypothetical protein